MVPLQKGPFFQTMCTQNVEANLNKGIHEGNYICSEIFIYFRLPVKNNENGICSGHQHYPKHLEPQIYRLQLNCYCIHFNFKGNRKVMLLNQGI
jgi:hypothetical protein